MVHRHAAIGRRTALIAVGTLLLSGICSTAAAEPPPAAGPLPSAAQTLGADKPSAEVLRAMERDLGLTEQQAATRLVNEAEAGTRAGRLRLALGKRFAGAWLSGVTSGTLTVATTSEADVTTIQGQGAKAAVVKASLADLTAVKGKLDKAASRVSTRNAPLWYVDVPKNRVVVEAMSRQAGAAFVEAAGLDAQQVAVRLSVNRPQLMENITGGDAYYVNGGARCSVGFSVTKGLTEGFATAGHCGDRGDRTTGYNRADQGTFQSSTFPGEDMAWVAVNANWTATADVHGAAGRTVQIGGSVEAPVGASVCRSGSTSGWQCGTIQQHGTSVSYSEGVVAGLTRTTVCAEPGDSGGPFVSGAQGQGMTSGGSGDCTSGGTTFYQPLNPVLSDFGLTLKTASTGAGAPDQQDGDAPDGWTAGRVYPVGATVTYGGVRYQCLQSHQAQGVWTPAATPALWQRM
ncbi:alpha-lytic protease prodomain-containing protein [Streptomyces sp. TRM70350]|uniref:alpha-lytic protease prodomain-containing protein n=1 Tax=Streptomyces sp. TRM70350 TaxID=2856165 RepID=UPI001C46DDE9|nr:alpha-lytic protease prodomain-containing protein [Streptomyces sp. TRM70350]MBV7698328.1 alpha-lytic protease prodomain-containing protein [Streptomyces sp. TRM70350]